MPIRLRLALWYAALFGVVLAAVTVLAYGALARQEYRAVDGSLVTVTEHYRDEIEAKLATGAPLTEALPVRAGDEPAELLGAEYTVYAGAADLHANFAVIDAAGNVLLDLACPGAEALAGSPVNAAHRPGTFATVEGDGGRLRLYKLPLRDGGATVGAVQTAVSLAGLDRSLGRMRFGLLAAVGGGVVAAAAGGWAIAARALRPIATMTETARAIARARVFDRRVPLGRRGEDRRDEVGELARCFNEMLDGLEASHLAQRRFVDDAAHELRAPLATITGNVELLARARDLPSWQREAILADVGAEAERLRRLVDELLLLARADAGQPLARERVPLDDLLLETLRALRPIAEGLDVGIAALEPVTVWGDRDRLKQLLLILIENALRYTPPGGKVRLSLGPRPEGAVVEVVDTGIGIDPDDLPRIFDRFYRGDRARGRDAGGSGLGLAIARWIAEAHGGAIAVASRPGRGSTFTVTLPLTDDPAAPQEAEAERASPQQVPSEQATAD